MASNASSKPKRRTRPPKPVIGWREWVVLGELGPEPVKAKVDTGAATSSLHAEELELVEIDGITVAHFVYRPGGVPDVDTGGDSDDSYDDGHDDLDDDLDEEDSSLPAHAVSLPVVGVKAVRSSNGEVEERPVVHTTASVGPYVLDLALTLTCRRDMGFPMLLGRRAVRGKFVVDVSRSFLASRSLRSISGQGHSGG